MIPQGHRGKLTEFVLSAPFWWWERGDRELSNSGSFGLVGAGAPERIGPSCALPKPPRSSVSFSIEPFSTASSRGVAANVPFFIDYLRDVYRQFDWDLALVIVLVEIAHHDLAHHFRTRSEADRETLPNYLGKEEFRAWMPALRRPSPPRLLQKM